MTPLALIAIVASSAFPEYRDEAPPPIAPIAAWVPGASDVVARIKALEQHDRKHNPDRDARVGTAMFLVTARTGRRVWLKRSVWTDATSAYAVASVTDVGEPLAALEAAETKAKATLSNCKEGSPKALLDWHIDAQGRAHAAVGCVTEPPSDGS